MYICVDVWVSGREHRTKRTETFSNLLQLELDGVQRILRRSVHLHTLRSTDDLAHSPPHACHRLWQSLRRLHTLADEDCQVLDDGGDVNGGHDGIHGWR